MREANKNPDFAKQANGVKSLSLITTVIWRAGAKRNKIHESVIQ
jgi:hypothetical protein